MPLRFVSVLNLAIQYLEHLTTAGLNDLVELDKIRCLMATSLMIEAITHNRDHRWFEQFRVGRLDEHDLEMMFLGMIQLNQLPNTLPLSKKQPEQTKRFNARVNSVNYLVAVKIIRMWHNMKFGSIHYRERIRYYFTHVESMN
ncbi:MULTISPECIES: hypothetical protein [Vibrio]|uniref:Uncharacterized protein n=2 Tax=Vibrio TaxID=662 RepID=A0A7X4LLD4_9VIBR|nr:MULTISPECIES: hypothetical protein [Vibrio]MBF9002649.1 hypothetical protein [Vibrio nitrifigilis]MZI93920.1 hypothetical protein [Vibrio eleionomae]